jgi:ribonuclease HI
MLDVFIDGACEPVNPKGTASYGLVVKSDGIVIVSEGKIVGSGEGFSNNVAEYQALLAFLTWYTDTKQTDTAIVHGDSKLVICQMSGQWRINGGMYYPTYQKCVKLFQPIAHSIRFQWIPREQNQEADNLSKQCLIAIGIISRH